MHDVAWRGMWICVRSKDAQKQLARTSLNKSSHTCQHHAEITESHTFAALVQAYIVIFKIVSKPLLFSRSDKQHTGFRNLSPYLHKVDWPI